MSSCAEADWSRWGGFCAGRRARSRARFVREPLTAAAATSMRAHQSARACMPRQRAYLHALARKPTGPSQRSGRVRADGGAARQEEADVGSHVGCEPDVRCSSSRRAHSDSAHSLSSKPTVPCSSRSLRHRTSGGCRLWLAPATAPGGSFGALASSATRGARARWCAGRAVAGAAWWCKSTDRFQPSSTPPTISALARRSRCGRATAIVDDEHSSSNSSSTPVVDLPLPSG
jgi:hypothetical protein